jgi:hypothetical protein
MREAHLFVMIGLFVPVMKNADAPHGAQDTRDRPRILFNPLIAGPIRRRV